MGRKRKRGCEASRKHLRFNPPFRTKTICLAVIKHCETSQNDCPLEHTSPHLHCTLILSFFVFTLPLSSPHLCSFHFSGISSCAHIHKKNPVTIKDIYTLMYIHSLTHTTRTDTTDKTHVDPRIRLTGWLAGSRGLDSAHLIIAELSWLAKHSQT